MVQSFPSVLPAAARGQSVRCLTTTRGHLPSELGRTNPGRDLAQITREAMLHRPLSFGVGELQAHDSSDMDQVGILSCAREGSL